MKDFLKKELYSLRAVTAILARWLLLAVPTGLVCGAVGTAFHLAVEHVTEWRGEHVCCSGCCRWRASPSWPFIS